MHQFVPLLHQFIYGGNLLNKSNSSAFMLLLVENKAYFQNRVPSKFYASVCMLCIYVLQTNNISLSAFLRPRVTQKCVFVFV